VDGSRRQHSPEAWNSVTVPVHVSTSFPSSSLITTVTEAPSSETSHTSLINIPKTASAIIHLCPTTNSSINLNACPQCARNGDEYCVPSELTVSTESVSNGSPKCT